MSIGRLRHPLTLERYESSQDSFGELVRTWVTVGREWASLEGVSGREFLSAQADQAETTWKITIRYRSDIDTTWRVRDGDRIFDINAVLPNNERTYAVLMCKSGLTD